jgi:hypothetical protein
MTPLEAKIIECATIAADLRKMVASPVYLSKSYDPAKAEALEVAKRLETHVRAYQIFKAMENA